MTALTWSVVIIHDGAVEPKLHDDAKHPTQCGNAQHQSDNVFFVHRGRILAAPHLRHIFGTQTQ